MKKRKDGRFQKKIVDPKTNKTIYFYGKTEREVNKKILEYNGKTEKGKTFIEISNEWWNEAENKLAIQTVSTYKPGLKRLQEFFKNKSIKEIKPMEILYFLNTLVQYGFAQKTIANNKLVCNLIFTYAVAQNEIEINPCSSVVLPKSQPRKKRGAATPQDEKIVKESFDVWLFPYIALYTGMRKGEILALQWKDINFTENIIHVTKSVCYEGDKPLIKEPKTETGVRVVPLLEPLKKVLKAVKGKNQNDYIISIDGKTPLRKRRFITMYNKYREKTGVKCTAHQLRHSFATIAFECGVPVKSVQEILGHKQLSTTMDIYTDFRKKSLHDAAQLLNEKLS